MLERSVLRVLSLPPFDYRVVVVRKVCQLMGRCDGHGRNVQEVGEA